MRNRTQILALLAASTLLLPGVTACQPKTAVTVTKERAAKDTTATLTPLERGRARTASLSVARKAIAAWLAADVTEMRKYWDKDTIDKLEKAWAGYRAQGLSIKHVREQKYLDVVDMNKDGSQVLVTYRFDDTSYLVNSAGKKVKSLPSFKMKEVQLTLDKQENGSWRVVRMIAGKDVYR